MTVKKARCPACGEIQMRYNPSGNNYQCSCGYVCDHHPDLCPTYHEKLGCIYSASGRRSGKSQPSEAKVRETRR